MRLVRGLKATPRRLVSVAAGCRARALNLARHPPVGISLNRIDLRKDGEDEWNIKSDMEASVAVRGALGFVRLQPFFAWVLAQRRPPYAHRP